MRSRKKSRRGARKRTKTAKRRVARKSRRKTVYYFRGRRISKWRHDRIRRANKLHKKEQARLRAAIRRHGSAAAARAAIRREDEAAYQKFVRDSGFAHLFEDAPARSQPRRVRASAAAPPRRVRLLEKLRALANDPGATDGERDSARRRISELSK